MRVAVLETPGRAVSISREQGDGDRSTRPRGKCSPSPRRRASSTPSIRWSGRFGRRRTRRRRSEMAPYATMTIVREYDLSDGLLAVTHVWQPRDGGPLQVAVKGAPEAVADLCRLDAEDRAAAPRSRVGAGAGRPAGARRRRRRLPAATRCPRRRTDFAVELRGLVGLADPARPSVRKALAECYRAGIRVVMITGDHPGTALAIGRAIGLDVTGGVLTGADIARLRRRGAAGAAWRASTSSRASFPSRSCGSCRRSRRTARSSP